MAMVCQVEILGCSDRVEGVVAIAIAALTDLTAVAMGCGTRIAMVSTRGAP